MNSSDQDKKVPTTYRELGRALGERYEDDYLDCIDPIIKALLEIHNGFDESNYGISPYEINAAKKLGCSNVSTSRRTLPESIDALVEVLGFYAPKILEHVPDSVQMEKFPSGWEQRLVEGEGLVPAGTISEDVEDFYLLYGMESPSSCIPYFEIITGEDEKGTITEESGESNRADEIKSLIADLAWQNSPYRGNTVHIDIAKSSNIYISKIDKNESSRDDIILPENIWERAEASLRVLGEEGKRMEDSGMRTHRGLLLQGQPGMGKTTLVRQLANESNNIYGATVLVPSAPAAKYKLNSIMSLASKHLPAVVILEDVDSISGQRGSTILSDYLSIIDGISVKSRILTISTTNDSSAIDPAVIRPGRIDDVIEIAPPTKEASLSLLSSFLTKASYNISAESILDAINAKVSDELSLSGAAIESLVGTFILHKVRSTEEAIRIVENHWEPIHLAKSYLDGNQTNKMDGSE